MSIKIPCLVAMRKSQVNILNCDFIGNEFNMTTGCIFLESEVIMSSTKFSNFKAGAIFTVSDVNTEVEIKDCEISKCGVVGVYT